MNAAKVLKSAVIAEIALIPVGILVSWWTDNLLPKEVLALEQNQTNAFTGIDAIDLGMIALIIGVFVMLGAWIASVIGLLKLKRWGAWLYLFTYFSALPVWFMIGFDVLHPLDQAFDAIYGLLPGIIIGLAFFSNAIPKKGSGQDTVASR